MYVRAETVDEFKILIYVTWRTFADSNNQYAISYSEWESILKVSHQTAVKLVKQCVNKGLITKIRGDYYEVNGEIRQMTNKYLIKEENVEQFNMTKEINTAVNSMTKESQSIETRDNNWFKTGDESWLNENDMYIYLTTKCTVLKEHGENRMNAISKSTKGKLIIEELKTNAMKRVKQEKRHNSQEKVISMNDYDMIESELRSQQYMYKPKRDRDYSYLLGDD